MKQTLRRIGVVSAAVLVTALAATGAWLLNPRSHHSMIEKTLGAYFNTTSSVGRVAWAWSRGSAGLDLRSVSLRGALPEKDAFSADRIRLVLDLAALLRRRLTVGSILLEKPRLQLTRTPDGLHSSGIPVDAAAWKGASPNGSGLAWSVERIRIINGSISYDDLSGKMPRSLSVSSLDLSTRPPASGQPVAFDGKAGFLSEAPNATFRGGLKLGGSGGGWTASLGQIRMGLDRITVRALELALPELEGLGLRGKFEGAVSGAVERIRHDGRRLLELEGNLRLEGAKLFVRVFKSPLRDLNASVHFDRDTVVISSIDGRIAGGEFFGRGEIRNLHKPDPDATFEFRAERIMLRDLFPKPSAGRTQLTGRASVEIGGSVQGRSSAEWLPTLQGEGRAALADGILTNTNLLRMIFDKLGASLPGAAETFARTMPQDIAYQLTANDTALAPAEIPFKIGNGGVVYPSFRIAGDGFEVNGSGQQGFGGDIDFRTIITLDPRISAYLIGVYPDVASIADSYGRLSLPVRMTGTIRNVRVVPDTQYLIGRILGVRGVEYLKKLL